MSFLYELFGGILKAIYQWIGSYGWAIVLFALFAKIITIPFAVKQQRSIQLMNLLAPAQEMIQKKYAKDQMKQQQELQKLYQKYNYNPLSGCLPLLIQFPILIGLWGALRLPETYVFTPEEYSKVSQVFLWIADMSKSPVDLFKTGNFNAEFFLSLILPILSVVLTIIQQKKSSQSATAAQNDQTKMMTTFMTVFIGYIGFTFNQGLALYWTLQTGLGIAQNLIMDKFFPLKVEAPKIVKKGTKA